MDKPYQCRQFDKGFSHNSELITHQMRHIMEKPYQCNQCSKAFSQNSNHKRHMRIHTGEKPYKCSHCDKAFTQNRNLNSHLLQHTAGERPYQCHRCDKAFSRNGYLETHMRKHTGEKPYKCSHCDKIFTHNNKLKVHLTQHTRERPYQCHRCDKAFSKNINLINHWKKHYRDNPYQCGYCDKQFPHKINLKTHRKNHTCEKSNYCRYCHKSFPMKFDFSRHLETHSKEIKDLPNVYFNSHSKVFPDLFNINPCIGNSITNDSILYPNIEEFVNNVSSHKEPYQCSHCDKTFSQKVSHTKHRQNNTCEKPNYCRHCHKSIPENIFWRHLKTHTKELLNLPHVSLKLDSKKLPELFDTDSGKGTASTIDSIPYHSFKDFTKNVSLHDKIYISSKPLEECVMCYKKFKLTQFTLILTVPLRMRITCANCRLVIYTIISNHSIPSIPVLAQSSK